MTNETPCPIRSSNDEPMIKLIRSSARIDWPASDRASPAQSRLMPVKPSTEPKVELTKPINRIDSSTRLPGLMPT
jgi:hypothetical protein